MLHNVQQLMATCICLSSGVEHEVYTVVESTKTVQIQTVKSKHLENEYIYLEKMTI